MFIPILTSVNTEDMKGMSLNVAIDNYKQYGIPQCVHSVNVPGMCFHISPDDGSLEPKYVAEI